jgi:hypothetical protein
MTAPVGPWTAVNRGYKHIVTAATGDAFSVEVCGAGHEAVARQIAALPDLLDAVRAVLEERENIEHETYGIEPEMAALAAAYAKAQQED